MSARSKKVTLGADIELFVAKAAYKTVMKDVPIVDQNLELIIKKKSRKILKSADLVPCVGLFKGTKAEPYTPEGWTKGFAIQEDNVMLEFNIPVCTSSGEFHAAIMKAKKYVTGACKNIGLIPMWDMPEYKWKPIDLTSPQAKLFACDPDLDAYTGGVQRDSIPDFGEMRTCGGHIHLGGDFNCPDFVAILFIELILTLYMGHQFVIQPDSARAKWYGRPGVYRTKPYGVEYRTLSNSWATTPYGLEDISSLMFRIGNVLVQTAPQTLQTWFRRIEWTKLQELLLVVPQFRADGTVIKSNEHRVSWQTLRSQWAGLNVPGLQL